MTETRKARKARRREKREKRRAKEERRTAVKAAVKAAEREAREARALARLGRLRKTAERPLFLEREPAVGLVQVQLPAGEKVVVEGENLAAALRLEAVDRVLVLGGREADHGLVDAPETVVVAPPVPEPRPLAGARGSRAPKAAMLFLLLAGLPPLPGER